jgi:rhamnosyltransferase
MMTPDAYAQDKMMLERLVEPIFIGKASVAYARQIPRSYASPLEAFPRYFNYPTESHIRSIHDRHQWGAYMTFCSNSCAAYCTRALDAIGGFQSVLTAEDAFAVARLLRAGHSIAYVAEAVVEHSHNYTLLQELRRHFDTGYVRKQHKQLMDFGVRDEQRGGRYAVDLGRYLLRHRPYKLPYALANTLAKYVGYSLGRLGTRLPTQIVRLLSAQDYYWSSDDFHRQTQEKQ